MKGGGKRNRSNNTLSVKAKEKCANRLISVVLVLPGGRLKGAEGSPEDGGRHVGEGTFSLSSRGRRGDTGGVGEEGRRRSGSVFVAVCRSGSTSAQRGSPTRK